MARFAFYGSDGNLREILPTFRRQLEGKDADIVLVDDDPRKAGAEIQGCSVMSFADLCQEQERDTRINVSVADPLVRQKLVRRCEEGGFGFFSVRDISHTRLSGVNVGDGAVLAFNTLITSDVEVGAHFHMNMYSYVAHDCVIGDFVTFGPRVSCNGRIHIGDSVCVGAGATIKQGTHDKPLTIGAGAVVGMGAVVIDDVQPGDVVAGNPSKSIAAASGGSVAKRGGEG